MALRKINVLFLWVFVWFSASQIFAQVSEGVPCDTPDGQYGLCINIKSCGTLINLLRTQSASPQVRVFLRSSTCGYIGNTPMVCCPQVTPKPKSPLEQAGNDNNNPNTNDGRNNNNNNNNNNINSNSNNPLILRAPECGVAPNSNPRVVGGVPATLGQFPWIVALGYRNANNPQRPKWLCGGSLITYRHVLTAGHCVHSRRDLYLARLGELDLYSDTDGATPEDIPLVKAKVHEDYSSVTYTNDIAILTLQRSPVSPSIKPVCLPYDEPTRSNMFLRAQGLVAGWGALYFNGPTSSTLQYVGLPVLSNDDCKRAFGNRSIIDSRILCAGVLSGGKDACQGDSGGPLIIAERFNQTKMIFYQIGVVSYGFRCAEAGYPGVYSRVTNFMSWIERNLN